MKKLRKATRPSKAYKKELWVELNVAWSHEYPGIRVSWARVAAVPVAALVIFVTMGTGVYAYSSPQVTEASSLYPVKQGIEQLQEKFHRSPESRSEFHAKMVERRIAEGEVMLERGVITPDQLIRIAQELDLTVEDFIEAKNDPDAREEIHNKVVEKMQTQNERYEHLIHRGTQLIEWRHEHHRAELRDTLSETRTRIDEADLSQDEKHALFPMEIRLVDTVQE